MPAAAPASGATCANRTVRVKLAAVAAAILASAGCAATQVQPNALVDKTTDPVPFTAQIGVPFELGAEPDALDLIVLNVTSFEQTPERFPRLSVAMRSENRSDRTLTNPDVSLHCDEAEKGGEYYGGSTWEMNASIKSGEFREGLLYIGFPPKDSNPQYSVATCTNPYLVLVGIRWNDRQRYEAHVDVPPSVITDAINAPIGLHLPAAQADR